MQSEIKPKVYDRLLEKVSEEFGVQPRKNAVKVPAVMKQMLLRASQLGGHSTTLNEIVLAVSRLRDTLLSEAPIEAEFIDFPSVRCQPVVFNSIGAVAAESGVVVTAEPSDGHRPSVAINPDRHVLLAVGRALEWLDSVCTIGDILVVDLETTPSVGELSVVWDKTQFWAGWAKESSIPDQTITLVGDPGSGFEKEFSKRSCEFFRVEAVLFDESVAAETAVLAPTSESRTAGMIAGYTQIDVGESAEPVLFPGDLLLVDKEADKSTWSKETTHLKGMRAYMRLSTGERVFKRVGNAIADSGGNARVLENIGGGESHHVRLSAKCKKEFQRLPAVDELRQVFGYWFVVKRTVPGE